MLKQLQKLLQDQRVLAVIAICMICIIIYMCRRESFSKLPRYMYMYNGIPRNASYDIRAEPMFYNKDTSKTGVFYESSLDANETNQRVRPAYQGLKMDVGADNKQHKILAYRKHK